MSDRRAALVDAGVQLALQQSFQDLLTSVDTRSITSAAGVTTGSFFHHFKNRAQFIDAVVERFVELWERSTERTLGLLASSFTGEGEPSVRGAASSEWSGVTEEEVLTGLQHLLWVARDQAVSESDGRMVGDVLRERNDWLDQTLVPSYEQALRAIRREMLPPFTVQELSIGLSALANGLEMRRAVDGDAVRDDLYADFVVSLVTTITRPARERAEERPVGGDRQPVGLTSGVREPARESSRGTRDQIAEAAAPLFVERRVGEVKIAEIAEVAGVSASTVYHQFGRVSAVAAAGWVRHLPELEAIAAEPLTTREGPVRRIEQILTRYIEIARSNRGALEGQVLETVAGASETPGSGAASAPIAALLAAHIRELRTRGVLRRRIDSDSLARSIVQLVAMRLLSRPEESGERIIDDTLGVLLEGALARTDI
ncbi:MAG: TetR/AcrR family transcriptional regulator [Acidimicrobiia bacterium]